ncbi:phospholipase A [Vibrio sp. SM6]|uniref:Phospholipase A1 n=1 Tax=Vibrio agarilyticus TaxID=2726741 RepID=A0A7X8TNC5_9VIBR|nr:phospholipase A [Vibrio agarilyticus]NLS11952.1 phospholipase A [Vibrio agarilyticus]
MKIIPSLICVTLSSVVTLGSAYAAQWSQPKSTDEKDARFSAFKDNYFLPVYHETRVNQARFRPLNPNDDAVKDTFIQFRFSVKYRIARIERHNLFLAYSQTSNWEAYASSAYFRDNDYNPELYYLLEQQDYSVALGFEHESNGAGGDEEVSWNRLYAGLNIPFDWGYLQVTPWVRVHTGTDYNPDIKHYLGYGETELAWNISDHQTLKAMMRNGIESGFSRGYYRLAWTFPVYQGIKGYAKAEAGYGTTISNYNFRHNAFGLGFYFEF